MDVDSPPPVFRSPPAAKVPVKPNVTEAEYDSMYESDAPQRLAHFHMLRQQPYRAAVTSSSPIDDLTS
jgi:hypothetical protein